MSDRTPFHEQVRAALEADRPDGEPARASGSTPSATGSSAAKTGHQRTGSEQTGAAKQASTRAKAPRATRSGAESRSAQRGPAAAKGSTRTARLRLTRLDPWSVMKTAFLLSIALGVVTVVSVAIVWGVLGAAGVWDSINTSIQQVVGDSGTSFDVEDYLGTGRVLGFTMLVAVADVILITAIATLGAFLYNLSAALLGGLEVTLAEDER
jgi:hypothetical protein